MDVNSTDLEAGCIAIVGVAGRFPAARSVPELWTLLREGREATQWLTEEELRSAGVSEAQLRDPAYVRASLVLPDMEMFDAEFFGFSKRDAAIMDPQHRHFLECAWEALEDAGHMPEHFSGAIGVFGGCGMQAYLPYNLLTNPQLVESTGLFLLRHTGNDKDFLCSRVSYLLNLKGPSLSIQTACSTSLVAVHVAAQSLLSGECDMALAGGVSIELPHRQGYRYAEGEILSPDAHCRAFDDDAAGTVFGSGVGIVVLRRLQDAIADGDNIYAVIRGSAVNNDGAEKAGYLAPSVDGQARAAVEALAVAGVDPASVSYVEAHGTGTPVGDPIEIAALTQAYGGGGGRGFCGIGSVKTNIGHLDTAASVASLIKVSLALRHGLIPASLNFRRPNSRIDLASTPFFVVDRPRPWMRASQPRRAAVNALGVGGVNAHVIVEEPPPVTAGPPGGDWQVLTLSARNPAALDRLKGKWQEFLANPPPGFDLADAAYTTQAGRRSFEHRCAVVASGVPDLRAALACGSRSRTVSGKAAAAPPGVVLMFPGGGAHYPGAGRELLGQPAFLRAVDECFALMPPEAPRDLRSLMFDSDPQDAQAAGTLQRPAYGLAALFTLEYALAKLWEAWGIKPAAVIGHSAGDYVAACCAGIMALPDALAVAVLRGRLFEDAPPGGMLSVDLAEAPLRTLMSGLELDLAAVNAPDLCVASGPLPSIAVLEERLAGQGLQGRRVHIDVAAHSRLLDGLLATFRQRVSRVRLSPPTIPFISNLDGNWGDAQALTDPEYWVRHLRQTVRFSDGVRKVLELPGAILLEAGPGQGLCALARQNGTGQPRTILPSTHKPHEPDADPALMLLAAGTLWTHGLAPDWGAVRGAAQRRRISLPTYAFDRQRHWIEPGVAARQEPAPAREIAASATQGIKRLSFQGDWFRVPQWRSAPHPGASAQRARQWLLFGSDSKLCAEIAAQLKQEGAAVTQVRRATAFGRVNDASFTLDPARPGHYASLFGALEQDGIAPDHILYLWTLDTERNPDGGLLAGRQLAFDSLVHAARAIQELDANQPIRLTVVTAGSQSMSGEPAAHPECALAIGPCRVIPRELPNVTTRLLDFAPSDLSSEGVARCILSEAQAADETDLVAYRSGERRIQQLLKAAPCANSMLPARLRMEGVYFITGGLGDIALELADYLASTVKARLALVGRRALPPRSEWLRLADGGLPDARLIRRLLALEAQGAQVLTLSANAADRAELSRAVDECRRQFGTLNGAFHAAGATDDGPIATKSADSIDRVLDPKARGAQVLDELLPPGGDLDFFAVFSSSSVYLGAPGQVDYVAANAFLDALAASRPDGLCIRWGIWGDLGMAARAQPAELPAGSPSGGHPLLGSRIDGTDGTIRFQATYDPGALWVLREHMIAGRPVLPGTAYIEIARAAMDTLAPGRPVEIRALSFEEAMVFEPAVARQVRVELRRSGEHHDFVVRSRGSPDESWQEHAHARLAIFAGRLPAAPPAASGGWRKGEIPQEHAVAFGKRWQNIARMRLADTSAMAEMELPDRFAGDLGEYAAHPAIVDMATTFGLHLVDAAQRREQLFVPLSIERVRLVAPVPARLVSRVELKSGPRDRLAVFDGSLHAPDGSPIAAFEGFSMRAVRPDALSHQAAPPAARRKPAMLETMLGCGIKAEDSHALFERIFSGTEREITVSSIELADLKRAIDEAVPKVHTRQAVSAAAAGTDALNPVERVIADAWRELLGAEQVTGQDDFFALGGHSLAAVRLFARIRKHFGVDLPLATLFQAPTLAALAALVAQAGGLDTSRPAAATRNRAASDASTAALPAWSPLVAICPGRHDRRPLFCVHGAGGNVLNFKIISDRLGPEQPFYGLQAQGVDGVLPPLATIEEMAAQYVQAIRSVDGTGPYRLAGYSAGGLIAFEMAQQLRRGGAQVELLAMIDTLSPTVRQRKVSYLQKLWLARHWSFKFALEWPARRRNGKLREAGYGLALKRLSQGEKLPPELLDFHLFRNFMAAQDRYQPAAYDGSLVLFKAMEADMEYLVGGRYLGWKQHIRGPLRVVDIAGSHHSVMAEPGVSELIEGLRKELALLDDEEPDVRHVGWPDPLSLGANAG